MRAKFLLDRIFLVRPSLLVPVWTFLLLGNYHSSPRIPQFAVPTRFLLAVLAYSMLPAGIYILNQLTDRESDRLNKKLFLIAGGHISTRSASIQMILLLAGGVIISILFFSREFGFFITLSLGLGILYSVRPIRLKARPFLDLLANAVGYGLLNFGIGWLVTGTLSSRMVVVSLPYMLAVAGVFVNTTIPDIPGDREAGDLTSGVFMGRDLSLRAGAILVGMSLIVSLLVGNRVCLVASALALPFFVIAAARPGGSFVSLSVRVGAPVLVLITAMIYPLFGLVLIGGVIVTRWYYKRRFDLVYPRLVEEAGADSPSVLRSDQ
jgi:chlorophyll synthase